MKYCVEETTHTQREVVANVTSGIMEKVSLSQRLLDALGAQYLEGQRLTSAATSRSTLRICWPRSAARCTVRSLNISS